MLVSFSAAIPPGSELQSYVYQPAFALDKALRLPARIARNPLSTEESVRLTEFVYMQAGKKFSKLRVYAQVTPVRSKIPLAAASRGRPNYDKRAYFCSELVMNACRYVGLIDAECARPSATYPRDIFYSRTRNLVVNRSLKEMNCGWAPPARWTESPVLMQAEAAPLIKIAR